MYWIERHWTKILVLALFGLGVLVAVRVYPAESISKAKNPDVFDTIFASRLVVAAARLLLVYTAIFIGLSVAARVWKQQWLRRAGPFEVSEDDVRALKLEVEERTALTEQLVTEVEHLETLARDDKAAIESLKAQLSRADDAVEVLSEALREREEQAPRVSQRIALWFQRLL